GHDVREHACQLIWLTRRFYAASRRLKDFYTKGLWATTSSGKVELNSLALDQLLDALRKHVATDVDIFISRVGDEAKTLFSVKPLNFADWHRAHHFRFILGKYIFYREMQELPKRQLLP